MEFSISPQSCRVCLKKGFEGKLLSDTYASSCPNAKESKRQSYLDIYTLVALVNTHTQHSSNGTSAIETADGNFFPKCICNNCEAQLIVAYEFIKKSNRSEKVLYHILSLYDDNLQETVNKVKEEPFSEPVEESTVEHGKENYVETDEYQMRVQQIEHFDSAAIQVIMTPQSAKNEIKKIDNKDKPIEMEEAECDLEEFMDVPQESDTNDECEDFYATETQEPKSKTSQCLDCGKTVYTHYLSKHRETHMDKGIRQKSFECDQCKVRFTLKENLSKHKRIHTNEKRYTCQFCQQQFLHWASRRYHIASHHTGEKRYTCEYCGAKFRNSSHYSIHIRRHTGVTPYPCHLCDRSFITSNSLKLHMASHSDSKNFHCDLCKKSYKTAKTLRLHQRTTHEQQKNYVCPVCNRAFSQNHLLKTHLLKTHPQYEPPPPGTVVNVRAVKKINEQLKRTGSV
ncbi:zinc finger protein OZF-like [Sabethes cyaneus]|uniref:zinc finger protein OZF-like n=1 Tax=Sabethes cyaneus TaxID=53552 RepID=UPI00237E699E|nr:zinc finger protein OZF-like [Sabethes cyaneus]